MPRAPPPPHDPLTKALAEREVARQDVVRAFHLLEVAKRQGEPEEERLRREARERVARLKEASQRVEAARRAERK